MKKVEELAKEYADDLVPSPSKYEAPYHTTLDRHNDITEAFEAGYKAGVKDAEDNAYVDPGPIDFGD